MGNKKSKILFLLVILIIDVLIFMVNVFISCLTIIFEMEGWMLSTVNVGKFILFFLVAVFAIKPIKTWLSKKIC